MPEMCRPRAKVRPTRNVVAWDEVVAVQGEGGDLEVAWAKRVLMRGGIVCAAVIVVAVRARRIVRVG
jgi:hypothetical protein